MATAADCRDLGQAFGCKVGGGRWTSADYQLSPAYGVGCVAISTAENAVVETVTNAKLKKGHNQ